MKRLSFFLFFLFSAGVISSFSQGILKKVANSMKDELLGNVNIGNSSQQQEEPQCACNQPELVISMGGSLKLDYKEMSVNTMDDGSFIVQDLRTGEYYIVKGGAVTGPLSTDDPRIAGYDDYNDSSEDNGEALMARYSQYIKKSGDKFTIEFKGNSYGPFAEISMFTTTLSGNWFAAMVIDNIIATEDQGKKMEEALNNAKTDQERMELAMQFAQQMQQKVNDAGGAAGMLPKLITNVEGSTFSPMSGGSPQGRWKYDEIIVVTYDKVSDLKGNLLMSIKPEIAGSEKILVSSDNKKYAAYSYGTLTFNDGKTLTDLFNPHLFRESGSDYLVYMYYSPKKNAIMQCRIPF